MRVRPEELAVAEDGSPELRRSELVRELNGFAAAPLGPETLLTTAVRRSLAAPALRLIAQDEAVRAGEDPEAVHQARVATRRLRANLGTLRPLVELEAVDDLRSELAWLGGALGEVRDRDVLLVRLRERVQRLGAHDAHAAERLLAGLGASRADAHAVLIAALESPRYGELVRMCAAIVRCAPEREELAADAFRPLMDGQWGRLRRAFDRLTPKSSDAKLHAARIAAKRARYAGDAFAPVFGDGSRKFLRRAAALQEVLGEHQDAVAAQDWLRRKASRSTPSVAFVAGELAAEEERARAAARASWPPAWRALSRAGVRFWT